MYYPPFNYKLKGTPFHLKASKTSRFIIYDLIIALKTLPKTLPLFLQQWVQHCRPSWTAEC